MGRVYHASDLHLGHYNILKFSGTLRDGEDVTEHDHYLIQTWNRQVRKRDLVFVHGDVCMHKSIDIVGELSGRKILIRGNHDELPTIEYLKHFEEVHGIMRYKGCWLTHAPIHPAELRGKLNVHGHVHANSIRNGYHEYDNRYINVSWEVYKGLVPHDDIKSGAYYTKRRC